MEALFIRDRETMFYIKLLLLFCAVSAVDARCSNVTAIVTESVGMIRYPQSYDYTKVSHCGWLIEATHGIVILQFDWLDTEINHEFVRVYDGNSTSSPLMTSVSGHTRPTQVYTSTQSSMYVTYTTDRTDDIDNETRSTASARLQVQLQALHGFSALYQMRNTSSLLTDNVCSPTTSPRVLNDTRGIFSTPTTWDFNATNVDCSWLIVAPQDQVVSVVFNSHGPLYESIFIYDDRSMSKTPMLFWHNYADDGHVYVNNSTQRYMFVRFTETITNSTDTHFSALYHVGEPFCTSAHFKCDNGGCILKYQVCNSRSECADESDEKCHDIYMRNLLAINWSVTVGVLLIVGLTIAAIVLIRRRRRKRLAGDAAVTPTAVIYLPAVTG